MVTRKRLRSILGGLALYVAAALLIGYFGVHAYSGNHGLNAKHELDRTIAELTEERDRLRQERQEWERRAALLSASSIDPDMLDERARALLNYAHPRDLVILPKN
jgi:cell division protein FtsB